MFRIYIIFFTRPTIWFLIIHTCMIKYLILKNIKQQNVFRLLKEVLIHSVIFKLYFAIILVLSSSVQIVQKVNWLRFSNFWTFAARVYFSEDNAILQRMSQRKCITKYVEETVYLTKYVEETVQLHFFAICKWETRNHCE